MKNRCAVTKTLLYIDTVKEGVIKRKRREEGFGTGLHCPLLKLIAESKRNGDLSERYLIECIINVVI